MERERNTFRQEGVATGRRFSRKWSQPERSWRNDSEKCFKTGFEPSSGKGGVFGVLEGRILVLKVPSLLEHLSWFWVGFGLSLEPGLMWYYVFN